MADKAEIEVTIGADGEVRLETRGLRGQACVEETRELIPALGRVRSRKKTREYYQERSRSTTGTRQR